MSTQLRTLQNLLILSPQDFSLESYNDKINRRLAALANLGQRYGLEGKGFYIKKLQLADIFEQSTVGSVDATKTLTIQLTVNVQTNDSDISKYTYNILTDEAGIRIGTFYQKLFLYIGQFIFERYLIHPSNEIVTTYGVAKSTPGYDPQNIKQILVELPLNYSFDVIFDSTTDTPIAFSSPILLPSGIFKFIKSVQDLKRYDLFSALFNIAVIIQSVIFEDEAYGNFDIYEYGLGICDDGLVLFNQAKTGISLQGALGITNQFIIASADYTPTAMYEGTVNNFYMSSMYGEYRGSISDLKQSLDLSFTFDTDLKGNLLIIIGPSSSLVSKLNQNYLNKPLQNGDILFSFVIIKQGDNSIFATSDSEILQICTSISFWQNNQWVPLRQADDITGQLGAFSFTDLVSTETIKSNIMSNIQEIIGGYRTGLLGGSLIPDYFRHRCIFFERVIHKTTSNNQEDNFMAKPDTYFYINSNNSVGFENRIPKLTLAHQNVSKTFGELSTFEEYLGLYDELTNGLNLSTSNNNNTVIPYLDTTNVGIYNLNIIDNSYIWQLNKDLIKAQIYLNSETYPKVDYNDSYLYRSEIAGEYLELGAKNFQQNGRLEFNSFWNVFRTSAHIFNISIDDSNLIQQSLALIEQIPPSSEALQNKYSVLHIENYNRINLQPDSYSLREQMPGEIGIGGTVKFYNPDTNPYSLITSKISDKITLSAQGITVQQVDTDDIKTLDTDDAIKCSAFNQVNITPERGLYVVKKSLSTQNENAVWWEDKCTEYTSEGLASKHDISVTLDGATAAKFTRIPVLPKYLQNPNKNKPVLMKNPLYSKNDPDLAFWYYGFTMNYLDYSVVNNGLDAGLKEVYIEYMGHRYLINLGILYRNGFLHDSDILLTDNKDAAKKSPNSLYPNFKSNHVIQRKNAKDIIYVGKQVLFGFYMPFINNVPAFTSPDVFTIKTVKKITLQANKDIIYSSSLPPYPVSLWSGENAGALYECLKKNRIFYDKNSILESR